MTRTKLFVLLVTCCSVMFVGLITLAAYYWSQQHTGIALICCLLGLASALGQFFALALLLRERARVQYQRQQAAKQPLNNGNNEDIHHE